MADMTAVQIDVWHDIACPWCFIGSRHLRSALGQWPDSGSAEVRHRAFQLQPDMPPAGLPAAPFFAAKFGGADAVARGFARVTEAGRAAGIDFALHEMPRAPNTMLAHRVVAIARGQGVVEAVVDALFSALFEQARDISDLETIFAVATEAGMAPDDLRVQLAAGAAAAEVEADLALASGIGVSGVPLFVVDNRGLSGAQPPENIVRFLDVVTAGVASDA
jgi:predicted DsbA family dithiol-disulfide isomerase